MERGAQTGRGRFVAIQEALIAEVMEVPVAREAGALFAVGATACTLSVTPGGAVGGTVSQYTREEALSPWPYGRTIWKHNASDHWLLLTWRN